MIQHRQISGIKYRILNITSKTVKLTLHGTFTDFYIDVIREDEDWVRTLVMPEAEFYLNFPDYQQTE